LKEEIRKYNEEFIDSQKRKLYVLYSNFEELNEYDFEEGEYGTVEMKSLEDI
jgi:hypothetical protein